MGRMYVAVFEGVSVSAVQDLFEVNSASTKVTIVHGVNITDDADETSEQLPFTMKRSTGTSGSGGSAPTARPMQDGDAAFAGTIEANNTTRATTVTTIRRKSGNLLGDGLEWLFTPEMRPVIAPSGRLVVGLEAAPGSARTLSGEIVLEEIG